MSPEVIDLVIDEIKNDKAHGASQLAREAAQLLKDAARCSHAESTDQLLLEQREIGQRLMSVRPAMAPIYNIVSHLLNTISAKSAGMDLNSIKQLTISEVDSAVNASLQAIAHITRYGSELVFNGDIIIAHSYSSTVMAMLKAAADQKRNFEIIVTRAGPGRSGEKIIQELGDYEIPITFIDDAATGLFMSQASKVVVGADRVCADGKMVNGIGTYPLSLAAERAGVPFYVLCEILKFDPTLTSDKVELEEKEISEIIEPGTLPPEVKVKNPHFDITPLELITGIVTENGLLTPRQVIEFMDKQAGRS